MTAFLDTNLLVYAQGESARSEMTRQVILEGGVIGEWNGRLPPCC